MNELIINKLEDAWGEKGALGLLRRGKFDEEICEEFLEFLGSLELHQSDDINRRVVSLLWYIPTFLEWQKERIEKFSGSASVQNYIRYSNRVMSLLEDKLGTP